MIALSDASPTPSSSPSRRRSSSDVVAVRLGAGERRRAAGRKTVAQARSAACTATRAARSVGSSSGASGTAQRRAIARGTSCPTTISSRIATSDLPRPRRASDSRSPITAPVANTVAAMPMPAANSQRCGRSRYSSAAADPASFCSTQWRSQMRLTERTAVAAAVSAADQRARAGRPARTWSCGVLRDGMQALEVHALDAAPHDALDHEPEVPDESATARRAARCRRARTPVRPRVWTSSRVKSCPVSSLRSSSVSARRDPELVVVLALDVRLLDVVLVADLADDQLERVFERHEPGRAAVLVDDDGDVPVARLEVPQLRVDASWRRG